MRKRLSIFELYQVPSVLRGDGRDTSIQYFKQIMRRLQNHLKSALVRCIIFLPLTTNLVLIVVRIAGSSFSGQFTNAANLGDKPTLHNEPKNGFLRHYYLRLKGGETKRYFQSIGQAINFSHNQFDFILRGEY